MMEVAETIGKVRSLVKTARGDGKTIGLVPTMGALHAGHLSLIETAVAACDFVVVTIFVNPTQFGPGEDLEKYPRTFDADLDMCREAGVDVIFAPSADHMYPGQNVTWINVERLTEYLCGKSRPGHFRGVTTVCAKLFNIVQADTAFFGQKDAQQVTVLKRMVADLNVPLVIEVCPTIREADGLAVSSRNKYLSDSQRRDSVCLYRSLVKCCEMVTAGVTDAEELITAMRAVFDEVPAVEVEYISIVDVETLETLKQVRDRALVALAVRIGAARLIDNIVVDVLK